MKSRRTALLEYSTTYLGLTPFQCLIVVDKTHYATSVLTLQQLLLVVKYKSYLRINALKSFVVAYDAYQLYNLPIMAYFAAKVYVKFY